MKNFQGKQPIGVTITLLSLFSLPLILGGTGPDPKKKTPVKAGKSTENKNTIPVEAEQIKWHSTYKKNRQYTGRIQARRKSTIGFEIAGTLLKTHVSDGENVKEGQVLAQLDSSTLKFQMAEAAASLTREKSTLLEMKNGARSEVISAATARLNQARAQRDNAQLRLKRAREINEVQAVNKDELDQLNFDLVAAEAFVRQREAELLELENGIRQEKISAQEATINLYQATINRIQSLIDKTTIKAPFNGQINMLHQHEGDQMTPGLPLLTMYENDIASKGLEVHIGLPATIDILSSSRKTHQIHIGSVTWRAELKSVLPTLDKTTRMQTAIFTLLPQSDTIPPKILEIASLELENTVQARGFWAPISALTKSRRGLWSIYILKKNESQNDHFSVHRADVELLHQTSTHAYLRGAINEGELFIKGNSERIVQGQVVKFTSRTAQ